ncbi:PREDICTED: uncharacterized protein LOC104768221 [Camelina sativa]|uniref:Uncharacterized protein LOC104768221 n=1 Tax=Camelina sativa TaxID=90675 RepID=A0ABM0XSM8_CAMSA|nr:PREDICTED: uncharacterized protein LOC104768221 [Camelina sativa]
MSKRKGSSQRMTDNSSWSPPVSPQFWEHTRQNYERFMAERGRHYDSSTQYYSLNNLPRFPPQARNQQPHPNSPPGENEETVVPVLADVNDLLTAPGRTNLPVLCPDRVGQTTWFRHDSSGKITKQILKMLKSDLPKPYPTYRSLPLEIKNRWFRAFAQEFNWDPRITAEQDIDSDTNLHLCSLISSDLYPLFHTVSNNLCTVFSCISCCLMLLFL